MARLFVSLCVSFGALTVVACATTPEIAEGPPSYAAIATRSDPRAALYADCIEQASSGGTYGHASDEDSNLILFTCTGAPARAFYHGLAARSAAVGSEVVSDGRTFRSTNAVERNLYGVDYCSVGPGDDFACVITLNAGPFLSDD